MPPTIPYKYYKYEVNGKPYVEAIASENKPAGYQEIGFDEFQNLAKQQIDTVGDGSGLNYGKNVSYYQFLQNKQPNALTGGPSNMVMGTDPLTGKQGQMTQAQYQAIQQQQADIASGKQVTFGQAGLSVPAGSAGLQNLQNPGSVPNQTLPGGTTGPAKVGVSDGPVVPGVTPGTGASQGQTNALQNASNSNAPGSLPPPSSSPSLSAPLPTAPQANSSAPALPQQSPLPSAPTYSSTSTVQQPTFGNAPAKPQLQQVPPNTYTAPDVSPYFQQYQSLLAMSQGEKDAQTKLNQLDASRNQSMVDLEGQPIALQFVTGQQAAVNKQYELSKLPLQNQLILAQQDRQSKLQAASAQLDFVKWQSDQALQQRKQQIDELLANNTITQQQYQNELAALQMQNEQAQQSYQNQMQALQYQNSLTQQQYENQFNQTQYQNQLGQQQYQNQFQQQQYGNELGQQNFSNQLALAQYQNQLEQQKYENTRQSALDVAAKNKPYEINPGSALVSPTGTQLYSQPTLTTQNQSTPKETPLTITTNQITPTTSSSATNKPNTSGPTAKTTAPPVTISQNMAGLSFSQPLTKTSTPAYSGTPVPQGSTPWNQQEIDILTKKGLLNAPRAQQLQAIYGS